MSGLREFQEVLAEESDRLFGDRWRRGSRLYWATSLAGEVGELCNLVKKEARDGIDLSAHVGEELADVVISAFLTASALGLDLESEVERKRERVRSRVTG